MAEYGLQMYSVRDLTRKGEMKEALRRVSEMGYKFVEFAGFFDIPAEQIKEWLDEYGLEAYCTHVGLEDLEQTIAYHKAIGCKHIVLPGTSWNTAEDMENNIKMLNDAQKRLAEEGMTLGYHNHSSEFYPTPYGKVVEDEVIARTNVLLEIDTFWLCNAGIDSVPYCEKLKDRIIMIHIKDGKIAKDIPHSFANAHEGAKGKALGEGDAPVKEVYDWALKNNIRMIVESEGLDPTGPEEVERCIKYLRSLEN